VWEGSERKLTPYPIPLIWARQVVANAPKLRVRSMPQTTVTAPSVRRRTDLATGLRQGDA
jgi:hypothetical protein